jgi:hypothetical protein
MKGTDKKETKSKKKVAIIASLISVIVILIIVVVALVVVFQNKNSKDSSGLYTKYTMNIDTGDKNNTVFSMNFNKSDKTFEEKVKASDKSATLSKGSYEEKDGNITLTSDSDKKTQTFATKGKYLVATDFLYDGKIPDSDKFEVKCSFTNQNKAVYSITFRKDGTYTSDENGDVKEGTYKRSGDIISRTDDASDGTIDYLIYNNQITNSYYIAK